jgi:hypothetical protein
MENVCVLTLKFIWANEGSEKPVIATTADNNRKETLIEKYFAGIKA